MSLFCFADKSNLTCSFFSYLQRVWASAPDIGDGVSKANRQLFLRLAVVICFCSSAYFWTGKPFDNLCEKPGEPGIYIECNQSSFRLSLWGNIEAFEWVAGGTEKALWMTEDQRELARYFGWFAIASILFFILDLMRNQFSRIVAVFRGSYKVRTCSFLKFLLSGQYAHFLFLKYIACRQRYANGF